MIASLPDVDFMAPFQNTVKYAAKIFLSWKLIASFGVNCGEINESHLE